jgi:hypothetical protein
LRPGSIIGAAVSTGQFLAFALANRDKIEQLYAGVTRLAADAEALYAEFHGSQYFASPGPVAPGFPPVVATFASPPGNQPEK